MGTPDFAARILRGLLDSDRVLVAGVYCQPDRPSGRGKKCLPPPVKTLALERGLPVFQPASLRGGGEQAALAALRPDFLVVAAYGMILPQAVLDMPSYAPVNVHTSLLPAYRGSAPVQRAVMDGCAETGVTVMRITYELDSGPVYSQARVPVGRSTSGQLLEAMAAMAVPMVLDVLDGVQAGTLEAREQEGPTNYAAKISKADGWLDLGRPVRAVDCHMRGVTPDPGAHVTLELPSGAVDVVLDEAEPVDVRAERPGLVLAKKGMLLLSCQDGCLRVLRLRPQGRKSMDAASFLNGQRLGGAELTPVGAVRPYGGA